MYETPATEPETRSLDEIVEAHARDRGQRPGEQKGQLQLWDWHSGQPAFDPLPLPSEPRTMDYDPAGRYRAVICAAGELLLVDPNVGRVTRQWHAQPAEAWTKWNHIKCPAVSFSPDGQSLLSYGTDPAVRVWQSATGEARYPPLRYENGHQGRFTGVGALRCLDAQFSRDGNLLAAGMWDNTVCLWDVATGRRVGQPPPHPDEVIQVRFSPDGRYLLTACRDGFARDWNCGDGRLAGPPLEHRGEVYAGVFTPDGRWVLTSTGGIVWDWRTGNPVTPPLAQDFACSNMAITPNGEYAVLTGFGAELQVLYLGDLYQRDEQDLDDLCLRAELRSGQRIHQGGGEVKLTTDEWLTRWRRFRQRYSESLPFSPDGDTP